MIGGHRHLEGDLGDQHRGEQPRWGGSQRGVRRSEVARNGINVSGDDRNSRDDVVQADKNRIVRPRDDKGRDDLPRIEFVSIGLN